MDLSTLLEPKRLETDGGFFLTGRTGVNIGYVPVHMAIGDWIDNNGCSYDVDEYKPHAEAHDDWRRSFGDHMRQHIIHVREGETRCTCGPEPEKPTYSTKERTPRLLSEVLGSIVQVEQIDSIPRKWLEIIAAPADESDKLEDEEGEEGMRKGKEKEKEKGKEPLEASKASIPSARKASQFEMQERRKVLLSVLRKWREEEKEVAKKTSQEDREGGEASQAVSNS
jgi:hypothetical protein